MEVDDLAVIKNVNRPKQPIKDPLKITSKEIRKINLDNKHTSNNIINLDSSDDETSNQQSIPTLYENTKIGIRKFANKKRSRYYTILQSYLQDVNKPSHQSSIVDLDMEDSDAPFIDIPENSNQNISTTKKASINNPDPPLCIAKIKNGLSIVDYSNLSLDQHNIGLTQLKTIEHNKALEDKNTAQHTNFNTYSDNITSKITSKSHLKSVDTSLQSNVFNQFSTRVEKAERSSPPSNNISADDVSKIPNLTYLGKIIRISGQPSLIENSSGLIFRAENLSDVVKTGKTNNTEAEMNLYRNFLNDDQGRQDLQSPNQDIHVKDFYLQKDPSNDAASKKISDLSALDKKLLPSKNMDTQSQLRKQLVVDNSSGNSNISGKKNQLMMSMPQRIEKQAEEQHASILIPYQPRKPSNTVLDLNLNINNTRSTTNSLNTISSSQGTLMLPNDSTDRYNLALGLVLNLNDTSQSNNSYQMVPQNQFTNLNNVALDVSFNVNKEKPATVTSNQTTQSSLSTAPVVNRDGQIDVGSNTAGNMYCCGLCSFRTLDIHLIQTHLCHTLSSSCHTKQIPISVSGNGDYYTTSLFQKINDFYCCHLCTFKTLDLENMKIHESLHYTRDKKLYKCDLCSFQTADLKVINSHKCFIVNKKKTARKRGSRSKSLAGTRQSATEKQVNTVAPGQFFCCMSCSFKTKTLSLSMSHECQKSKPDKGKVTPELPPLVLLNKDNSKAQGPATTLNMQDTLNNLDTFLESPIFVCEICKEPFKRIYRLFHHIRRVHFAVKSTTIFGCCLCIYYVDDVQVLIHHLQVIHRTPVENARIICKELFMCTFCHMKTNTFQSMTNHFDDHIKSYPSIMKIILKSYQQDLSRDSLHEPSGNKYNCILCGKEADSITSWLTHDCMDQFSKSDKKYSYILPKKEMTHNCKDKEKYFYIAQKRQCNDREIELDTSKQDGSEQLSFNMELAKRSYKRRLTKPQKNLCRFCQKQVIGEALQCKNSECVNLYHLKCVEMYKTFMDSKTINQTSNWFCLQCNEESVPVKYDVDIISWSMDLSEKEYQLEVDKQKSMIDEVNKIKNEKITMKEEFEQIKTFIMECKSKRINNSVVKGVCSIVESFMKAGIDSSD